MLFVVEGGWGDFDIVVCHQVTITHKVDQRKNLKLFEEFVKINATCDCGR